MTKARYPNDLMDYLGLSHDPIDKRSILSIVLNKCSKKYGTNYNVPFDLYKILHQSMTNELEFSVDNNPDQILLRTTDIKKKLDSIAVNYVPVHNYVEVSKSFSDISVKHIEVTI